MTNKDDILAADWVLYYDERGHPFYYNSKSGETSWSIPSQTQTPESPESRRNSTTNSPSMRK